jgi:hypothetical protein
MPLVAAIRAKAVESESLPQHKELELSSRDKQFARFWGHAVRLDMPDIYVLTEFSFISLFVQKEDK